MTKTIFVRLQASLCPVKRRYSILPVLPCKSESSRYNISLKRSLSLSIPFKHFHTTKTRNISYCEVHGRCSSQVAYDPQPEACDTSGTESKLFLEAHETKDSRLELLAKFVEENVGKDRAPSVSLQRQNPYDPPSVEEPINSEMIQMGADNSVGWKEKARALLYMFVHDEATNTLFQVGKYGNGKNVTSMDDNQFDIAMIADLNDKSSPDALSAIIGKLLDDAEEGVIRMNTEEYNLILLAIVTCKSNFNVKMIDLLMKTYAQMKEFASCEVADSSPSVETYSLLLRVLPTRLRSRHGSLEVCSDVVADTESWMSSSLIATVMQCFAHYNEPVLGKQFVELLVDEKKGVPSGAVFLPLIRAFKRKNMIQEALEMFDICIKVNGYYYSSEVDDVALALLRWKDGASRTPNLRVVLAVRDKIDSLDDYSYRPGWVVWNEIALSLGILAERDPTVNWDLVRQAIMKLVREHFHTPRLDLVSIGLSASKALGDSQLAVDLLNSFSEGGTGQIDGEQHQRNLLSVPRDAFRKAIDICIEAGDIDNCFGLLDLMSQSFPPSSQAEFYAPLLKRFVVTRQAEKAIDILSTMREKGIKTSEQDYGSVMAVLVKDGKSDEAQKIFENMKNGVFGDGIRPGVNAYNAMMMSHVITGEFQRSLSVYDTMLSENITPNTTTMQFLLIASIRQGENSGALDLLRSLIESKMTMDKQGFEHCLKFLMPKGVRASSLADVRLRIRDYGARNPWLKQTCASLCRSIRVAEVEEERHESTLIVSFEMKHRREKAWRDVVEHTLEFLLLLQDGQGETLGDDQVER